MPDPMPPACLHPVPEDLWGRPALALHVQPHLEPAAQAALHALQGEVALRWPARLHRAPAAALHLTIYPLVPVRGAFDRDAYWAEIAAPTIELLRGLCAASGPFRLRFERVRVAPAAIIAVARDGSGLIERIRPAVAETLPPPPGLAPMRYDLIHSTLARYAAPDPIPGAAVAALEALPVAVEAPVARLKIVRETVYPCLAMQELASFPLADGGRQGSPADLRTIDRRSI
jgi:hypothetical protein